MLTSVSIYFKNFDAHLIMSCVKIKKSLTYTAKLFFTRLNRQVLSVDNADILRADAGGVVDYSEYLCRLSRQELICTDYNADGVI